MEPAERRRRCEELRRRVAERRPEDWFHDQLASLD